MRILQLLREAHERACERENASTQSLFFTYENSRSVRQAVTAAIQSFGHYHAPIEETYVLLTVCLNSTREERQNFIDRVIEYRGKVPGFGSSFFSGEPDPNLEELDNHLFYVCRHFCVLKYDLMDLEPMKSKKLFPNLAFYTAAVAIHQGVSLKLAESFLLEFRVPKWMEMLRDRYADSNKEDQHNEDSESGESEDSNVIKVFEKENKIPTE